MIITLDEVVKRVQDALEDPSGSFFTKDYLLSTINQKWDKLNVRLMLLNLKYQEQQVVIADLPANTVDLSAYQAAGQPLANMIRPKKIEWKLMNALDTTYDEADRMETLPDVDPGTQGIVAWVWRASIVRTTPSSIDITARVTFDTMNANLVDANDNIIAGTTHILAAQVADMVSFKRGNEKLSAKLATEAQEAMEDFEVLCVMARQGIVERVPRMSQRSRFNRRMPIAITS